MSRRVRLALLPLVALVLGATPAAAAPAVTVKGQVVGSPYVADASRTAVPVLLSRESQRRAKLASPLGVVVVPRRTAVTAPGGEKVLPGRLRLGDRFSGRTSASKEARASTYPRLAVKRLTVTKRTTQLSTAELQEEIARTRKDLALLSQTVGRLATFTQEGFAALGARVTAVTTSLAALRTDLDATTARVDGLAADLASAETALRGEIDAVRADLQPQVTAIADGLAALGAVLGECTAPASVLGRLCTLEGGLGGVTPTDLGPLTDRVDAISGALTGLVNGLTGLTLVGDLPGTLANEVTSLLVNLTGLTGTVGGLSSTVGTLTTTVSGLDGSLAAVETLLDGVDVAALQTTVAGVTGQVSNLVTTLGSDPSGVGSSVLSTLQTSLTGAQSSVSGILTYLSPGDGNLATLADNTLNQATTTLATVTGTTIPAVQSQLATVCTTWRTTLSGATAPVYNLLTVLLGSATLPTLPGC